MDNDVFLTKVSDKVANMGMEGDGLKGEVCVRVELRLETVADGNCDSSSSLSSGNLHGNDTSRSADDDDDDLDDGDDKRTPSPSRQDRHESMISSPSTSS